MKKSFYLEDMVEAQKKAGERHFIIPTPAEIDALTVGSKVRLFFILNVAAEDGCRAERMWVNIIKISKSGFKGTLTNQPVYIKELSFGNVVEFSRQNIATLMVKSKFDEQKRALISKRAAEKREVNWLYRTSPHNNEDSGWKLFYGDEEEEYTSDASNIIIASLEQILSMEPRLEDVFASQHPAFEWDEGSMKFVVVKD